MTAGRVALVGAGPGDPALLTLRALELIRSADVVAHDDLVSESVLALVPAGTELFSVGRRAGRGDAGYRLHPEVAARALAGKFVVRLKAGDPLIFGRGGEEAEELAALGVAYEIVPGITAALGAASYAGMPLTHRGVSAQVLLATGHRKEGLDVGRGGPEGQTLVLYMASRDLGTHLAGLVADGWPPRTPAALVLGATTPDETIIDGELATLAHEAAPHLASALPALVIVGEVVGRRAAMDWRGRLSLRGRRVIVARAKGGRSHAASALRTLGADVLEAPDVAPARWPSRIDLVVLPTSSAARTLYASAPAAVRDIPAVAIGARAEGAARALGVRRLTRAAEDSLEALGAAAARVAGSAS